MMFWLGLICITFLSLEQANGLSTIKKAKCTDELGQVSCWMINYNNGNGEDLIYFYKKEVDYEGEINGKPQVIGQGDIENGIGEATFTLYTDKTDDKRIEANVNSHNYTLTPDMYVSDSSNAVNSREIGQLSMETFEFEERQQNLPKAVYFNVQPVMDKKFIKASGSEDEAKKRVKGMLEAMKKTFMDKSLNTKIMIKYTDPVKIDADLTANPEGVATIFQSSFDFSQFSNTQEPNKQPNGFVFITQTPLADVPPTGFTIEYALDNNACSKSLLRRLAIMEYFATNLIAANVMTRVIGNLVGMKADYLGDGKVKQERKAANGDKCNGVGGFMDTEVNPNKFTTCSNDDFKALYNTGALKCLGQAKCDDKKDSSTLCPAAVKNIPKFCDKKELMNSCALSCDPLCGADAVAKAVVPNGCGAATCSGSAPPGQCPKCEPYPKVGVKKDCLKVCPMMKVKGVCNEEDGAKCCRQSCTIADVVSKNINPGDPNKNKVTTCDFYYEQCSNVNIKTLCPETCVSVNVK